MGHDIERLAQLIASYYSNNAADTYRTFRPTETHLRTLGNIGRDVLTNFPSLPGACAMMTALYVARWEMEPRPPVYAVAGELYAGGNMVFGSDILSAKITDDIGQSNPSWDGHYWLALGPYIADVSVFRTAYSSYSPIALARHVTKRCGTGRGLLIADSRALDELGFDYIPRAVLTSNQVTGLARGATPFFK